MYKNDVSCASSGLYLGLGYWKSIFEFKFILQYTNLYLMNVYECNCKIFSFSKTEPSVVKNRNSFITDFCFFIKVKDKTTTKLRGNN